MLEASAEAKSSLHYQQGRTRALGLLMVFGLQVSRRAVHRMHESCCIVELVVSSTVGKPSKPTTRNLHGASVESGRVSPLSHPSSCIVPWVAPNPAPQLGFPPVSELSASGFPLVPSGWEELVQPFNTAR